MARPSKFTESVAGVVVRAVGRGLTLKAAAFVAGVSESTLHEWRATRAGFAPRWTGRGRRRWGRRWRC